VIRQRLLKNTIDDVENINFDSDDFYSTPASVVVDVSNYSCDEVPEIEINLDMTNTSVNNSLKPCEDARIEGMFFCHNDTDVNVADQRFFSVCQPQNP